LFSYASFFILSGICGAKFSKILQDLKDVQGAEKKACEARTVSKTPRRLAVLGACKRLIYGKPLATSIQFSSVTKQKVLGMKIHHTQAAQNIIFTAPSMARRATASCERIACA
jgi:hypothetical protein